MKKAIDKWSEVHDEARAILHFLEWLRYSCNMRVGEKKTLTKCVPATLNLLDLDKDIEWKEIEYTDWFPKDATDLQLVYEYFGIDPDELEKDRRALLEQVRSEGNL